MRQTLRAKRLAKEMMLALSKTVDAKDHYTNGHSERVAAYAAEIARRMGKNPQEQEKIYEMGLLHDVGKIGVSEEIINKTSRLTDEEFVTIKGHTVTGSEILSLITDMPELARGARSHHERYDGRGYPDGLRGNEIPEAARIICLADCYDAMTSTRTYSTPRPQAAVRAEIARCAGTQFDPEIMRILLQMIDEDTDYQMTERTADIGIWRGSDRLWQLDRHTEAPNSAGMTPAANGPDSANVLDAANGPDSANTPPAANVADAANIPEWLNKIDGIDTERGLTYCGGAGVFCETLAFFYRSIRAKADEIEGYWNSGDLKNYTVKVHALKSSARTVGALKLSERARLMEDAGNAENAALIDEKTPELLELFRSYSGTLKPLFDAAQEDDREMIDPDTLVSAYESLSECAEMMDYDMAEMALDSLQEYRLPPEDAKRVEDIRAALTELDWERVSALCG